MSDEIRYPPGELVVSSRWDDIPAWVYLLAFLWTVGSVGGIWYIIERIADA